MREELIRVLKAKLDDVNRNIDSLEELDNKIKDENEKLSYAKKILSNFKDGDEYNILNFVKLSKDDFIRVLGIVDNDSDKIFSSNGCNYDGLIYLINGINNGVSLNLTDEQKNGIEYLVRGISEKEEEYASVIDGLLLAKTRFPISDVDALNNERESYSIIIGKFNANEYVSDTDKICEALTYCGLDSNATVKVLNYLLEYNDDIYKSNRGTSDVKKATYSLSDGVQEEKSDKIVFKPINFKDIEENHEEVADVSFDEVADVSFDNNQEDVELKEEEKTSVQKEDNVQEETVSDIASNEDADDSKTEFMTFTPFYEENVHNDLDNQEENKDNEINFEQDKAEDIENNIVESTIPEVAEEPLEENVQDFAPIDFVEPTAVESQNVTPPTEDATDDENFKDVITSKEDYEELDDEKTSTREIQRLFDEFEIKKFNVKEEMLDGNINNYRSVLQGLKENNILSEICKNENLFYEILLSSGEEEIAEVLRIIREDLSVDEDDYRITLRIVINTMPTIFIKDGGNYDNFVKNVKLFKEIGINLISLFDFSKEVFIADNELAISNYNAVKKYNVEVDYRNAKYFLVLHNITERMDYYVESVYVDQTKNNEKFDGITYINNYAVKLNTVTDLTIKRLRFSSENGKKVFGSKPNSLTGEITNLKVNVLDISNDYLNNFFDNEFDGILTDEVREYTKLIRNSSNVGNYSDELSMLEEYHKDLRYIIDGINISYNKVVRNYNILRSYGITNNKALHFALCYNLVITKEEYQKLKEFVDNLGGNA